MRPVVINHSFGAQRVTGQQRYATEIARRLEGSPYVAAAPVGSWTRSTWRVWAWVQLVLPLAGRGSAVLSMTSRAPLWQRRHVIVVHDLFVLTHPEWYSRRYVWTHAPLLRAQLRAAAAVVAVSRPVADEIARLRGGPEGIVVAPNAASEVFRDGSATADDAGDTGDTAVLAARGLRPGQYLLTVGNRDPRKNLARLAEAYGGLSDDERRRFPLVVVGGGAAIYRGESFSWPEGTVDAGYVDDDELRRLYRHARSVVLVAKAEGFGLPLVEAAAAGARGLLVSDIEVFRWICGENARYVDPSSTPAVTAGLRREIESPQQQEMDLERFDWDVSASVVGDLCRRVAAG